MVNIDGHCIPYLQIPEKKEKTCQTTNITKRLFATFNFGYGCINKKSHFSINKDITLGCRFQNGICFAYN